MGLSPSDLIPTLLKVEFGEKGYAIRIRNIALHMVAQDNVIKLGPQRDHPHLPIDNLLKPPQLGVAFRCVDRHGNGLVAERLGLSIGITPEVTEALRQPVPVDEVADIG